MHNKCKKVEVYRMTEKAREARRAYKRKWAKENPEKVQAQQERYWAKKAAEAKADPPEDQSEGGG